MRLLSLVVIFFLCSSIVLAYPPIKLYGNFTQEEKQEVMDGINLFPPKYFSNVKTVEIYNYKFLEKGKYLCGAKLTEEHLGGFYCRNGRLIIDEKGLKHDFVKVLIHELKHSKCYKKKHNWDLSHDSQCFTNGLV